MQELFKKIALVAPTDVPVLITGESGTGKELVARAIHRHSGRRDGPFLPVCLAALSPGLVERELFGHLAGSFTGASQDRKGLLELANGGTVLLDEVGDIPPALQVKLLRAIEHREVTPVGDARPRPTDIRVIAATNRPLAELMAAGQFREDLYFRLSVFPIHIPPLRDRREDIPALAEHFLDAGPLADVAGGTPVAADASTSSSRAPGRATSASCETPSSTRRSSPAAARFGRSISRRAATGTDTAATARRARNQGANCPAGPSSEGRSRSAAPTAVAALRAVPRAGRAAPPAGNSRAMPRQPSSRRPGARHPPRDPRQKLRKYGIG